jgi:Transcriptional regulator containing an amidase domain and an AraC-type DNA-binding HTH domain
LGSYLLARAACSTAIAAPVHWENLSGFIEEFPQLEVTSELFEIDRDRFTCSGGIAAFDLMLHVITGQHGFALASAVSDQFIHERIRDKRDRQRMALPARLGIRHPKLLAAIRRMEENLEEPVSRSELPGPSGSPPASSSACSANISAARRRASIWICASTRRASSCSRRT